MLHYQIDYEPYTSCLTTKFVLIDKHPIVFIVLDNDGIFSFFSDDEYIEEDIKVCTIKEIIILFPEIKNAPSMTLNSVIYRENELDFWKIDEHY